MSELVRLHLNITDSCVFLRSPRRCGNILKTGTEETKPTGKTKWSNSDKRSSYAEQWNFTNAEQFAVTCAHTGTNAPNKKNQNKKTPNKTVFIKFYFIYICFMIEPIFFLFCVKSDLSHFGT